MPSIPSVTVVLLGLSMALPASAQEPCADPRHREFDFWLGEWDIAQELLLPDGSWLELPARSTVRRAAGGCALVEEWHGHVRFFWEGMVAPAPLDGLSVRAYDPASDVWRIWWLDSRTPDLGTPFEGRFVGDEGVFLRGGSGAGGGPPLTRIRFHDITSDSLGWELAVRQDDGASWTPLWRMRFRRAAPPESDGFAALSSRGAWSASASTSMRSRVRARGRPSALPLTSVGSDVEDALLQGRELHRLASLAYGAARPVHLRDSRFDLLEDMRAAV